MSWACPFPPKYGSRRLLLLLLLFFRIFLLPSRPSIVKCQSIWLLIVIILALGERVWANDFRDSFEKEVKRLPVCYVTYVPLATIMMTKVCARADVYFETGRRGRPFDRHLSASESGIAMMKPRATSPLRTNNQILLCTTSDADAA